MAIQPEWYVGGLFFLFGRIFWCEFKRPIGIGGEVTVTPVVSRGGRGGGVCALGCATLLIVVDIVNSSEFFARGVVLVA